MADATTDAHEPAGDLRAPLFAAVAAVAVSTTLFGGTFTLDDAVLLHDNPVANGTLPFWHALFRDFWGGRGETGTYRPVVSLLLALEFRLGGGEVWPFRLVSVLSHAAVAASLVVLARRVVPTAAATAAGLLFAVFAPAAEAWQCTPGIADVWFALLGLWGLAAHRLPGPRGTLAACVALLLALGTKESALVLPLAWLVVDAVLGPAEAVRMRVSRLAAYAGVVAAFLALRFSVMGALLPGHTPTLENALDPAHDRLGSLLGAARVLATKYVPNLLVPANRLYLCSAPECGPAEASDPLAWAGLLLALLVGLAPILLLRRSRVAAAGLAWFVLLFAPASNLLAVGPSIYGERLLYAPALGLAVAVGAGLSALEARGRIVLIRAIFCCFLLLHGSAVLLRNLDWRDNDALYLSGPSQAPDAAVVHANAAHAHFHQRDPVEAERSARRALALRPDYPVAESILASALDRQDRVAEAEATFRQALGREENPDIAADFARMLVRRGRIDEARALLDDVLRRKPGAARLRALRSKL